MEHELKRVVGLWIDHQRAVIVRLDGHATKVLQIKSDIEGSVGLKDDAGAASGRGAAASGDQPGEPRARLLQRYYRRIIDRLRDTRAIVIFGPGAAKLELRREIDKTKELASKVIGVEATDEMTTGQVVARVKEVYVVSDTRPSASRAPVNEYKARRRARARHRFDDDSL